MRKAACPLFPLEGVSPLQSLHEENLAYIHQRSTETGPCPRDCYAGYGQTSRIAARFSLGASAQLCQDSAFLYHLHTSKPISRNDILIQQTRCCILISSRPISPLPLVRSRNETRKTRSLASSRARPPTPFSQRQSHPLLACQAAATVYQLSLDFRSLLFSHWLFSHHKERISCYQEAQL